MASGASDVLHENRFRLLNIFGGKGQPGINRNGNDAGITGGDFLGYEGNWIREDAQAYESNPAGIQMGFGDIYGPRVPTVKRSPATAAPCVVITRRPAKSNAPSTPQARDLVAGRVTSRG